MTNVDTLIVALSLDARTITNALSRAPPGIVVATEQEVGWAEFGSPNQIAGISANDVVFILSENSFMSSWLLSTLILSLRVRGGRREGLSTFCPPPGLPEALRRKHQSHYKTMMLPEPNEVVREWLMSAAWAPAAVRG